jgi:hydroxymethylglutaryl-CoA reductase (NADPH)
MAENIMRIPHDARRDYDEDFVAERRAWLSRETKTALSHISRYSIRAGETRGNIENFIGVAQIPLGVIGPLKINGKFAEGTFYVPFATTEGAMVLTYQRGAVAITKAGGARTSIIKDENHLDPVFIMKNMGEAETLVAWIKGNFDQLKDKVREVTGHGELLEVVPFIMGRRVALKIAFFTQDAMGANMIGIATEKICRYISEHVANVKYLLRSNLSSEKKASGVSLLFGYGKTVLAEAVLPRKIVTRHLNSTPEDIHAAWHSWALGSFQAGMLGINAHLANGVAGIFMACGQDVAHVANASVGITMLEMTDDGDLYIAVKLPNVIVGTVGGGTALGTQRECLEMIGCYGSGKSGKFAEVLAASLLAGEIGICAGITTDEFLDPHKRARVFTREKAFLQDGTRDES